jgi:hypothetical protein
MPMPPRFLIPLFLVAFALLGAGLAQAELSQDGNVRISFSGNFTPRSLPRGHLAPVTVEIRGAISTTDGSHPPAVQRVEVALNRNGKLTTQGLPECSGPLLQSTSTETALERCRPALVGRGSFGAEVELGGNGPVFATGKTLAFYGKSGGKRALFLHLYITTPVRATFVLPLTISQRRGGHFGTVLAAKIPSLAAGLGSVTKLDLTIGREYSYRGRPRSFLSASCPAPAGFTGVPFSLSRGSFYFAGGRKIDVTLSRDCRVR